jgi:hypothetical protein
MALPAAERLIGWGEGLTPAGDDYLVGLMAGLYSLSAELPLRRIFLRCLAAAVLASVASTTPVSAHFLRLAAHGHFTADVHRVRDALLSANEVAPLRRFVDDMLAVGATSGADVLTGLLSGICAWFQPPPTPNRT